MFSVMPSRVVSLQMDLTPRRRIKAFKEHARERYLTTEELARLGSALKDAETVGIKWAVDETRPTAKHVPKGERRTILGPHPVAAIRLLLFTGCRLREILHLCWNQIDWERGLALLPDSKTGRRYVVLNAPALAVLDGLPRISAFVVAGEKSDKPRSDLNRPWRIISKRAQLESAFAFTIYAIPMLRLVRAPVWDCLLLVSFLVTLARRRRHGTAMSIMTPYAAHLSGSEERLQMHWSR